jgi:hypothetical protein
LAICSCKSKRPEDGAGKPEHRTEEEVKAQRQVIQKGARAVIKLGADLDVELGYDRKSVEWLDGYIERNRAEFTGEQRERLVFAFGAFLGEAIITTYGGEWTYDEEYGWVVDVQKRITAFPFETTGEQFENGQEDSIASFFRVIPTLMEMSEREELGSVTNED